MINLVKADKRAHYERSVHEVFWPLGRRLGESDPLVRRSFEQTRILHPAAPNPDGTWTYAFLMDPRAGGANYVIQTLLKRGLPAAEGARVYREQFEDALVIDGRGGSFRFLQSKN